MPIGNDLGLMALLFWSFVLRTRPRRAELEHDLIWFPVAKRSSCEGQTAQRQLHELSYEIVRSEPVLARRLSGIGFGILRPCTVHRTLAWNSSGFVTIDKHFTVSNSDHFHPSCKALPLASPSGLLCRCAHVQVCVCMLFFDTHMHLYLCARTDAHTSTYIVVYACRNIYHVCRDVSKSLSLGRQLPDLNA